MLMASLKILCLCENAANVFCNAANETWLISANGAIFRGECSSAAFRVFLLCVSFCVTSRQVASHAM